MSHLSPQQIEELKRNLEERLAKLEDVTDTLDEESPQAYEDWANDNSESGEEALEAYDMLENETLGNEADNLKIDIQKALNRIADGTYGKDVNTGEPIPFERLKLYPWATENVQPEK
jgi:DnaK suppressor protein